MFRNKIFKYLVAFVILNSTPVLSIVEQAIFDDNDIMQFPVLPDFSKPGGITMPGTKWCGPGDVASHKEDLGFWEETDICCRAHDNCKDIIEAGQSKHGLKNSGLFTTLHCDCEQEFLNCLQKGKKVTSISIGTLYFGFRKYCFKEDYPIVKCAKYHFDVALVKLRCVRYVLDDSKPKKWQWFEIPFFTI